MPDPYADIRLRAKSGLTTVSDLKFLLSEIDRLTAVNAHLLRENSVIDDLQAEIAMLRSTSPQQ